MINRPRIPNKAITGTILMLGIVAATLAIAQQFTYRDKGGNMVLTGLTSWKIVRVNENEFTFEGSGSPFVGVWKQQQLTVSGNAITGTARRAGAGGFELSQAVVSGGVNARITRPSGNSWLEAGKITLTNLGDRAKATLSGDVHIRRGSQKEGEGLDFWTAGALVEMDALNGKSKDPVRTISTTQSYRIVQNLAGANAMTVAATGNALTYIVSESTLRVTNGIVLKGSQWSADGPQRFEISAPTGAVLLVPEGQKGAFPVRAFDLDGGIKMSLHTERRDKAGKADPVQLSGRCRSITYQDSERTMRLIGDVYLEGSDNAIFGTVEHATQAIIKLDEKRNFLSVELRGEPGASTIRGNKAP